MIESDRSYDKDGARHHPTGKMMKCGRCGFEQELEAVRMIGDSLNDSVWNDDNWLFLSRYVSRLAEQPPAKFQFAEESSGEKEFPNRRVRLDLCTRCASQFNKWLARAD